MAAWLSGAAARTAWRALDLAGSSRPVEPVRCRCRYSSHTPRTARTPTARPTRPGMIQLSAVEAVGWIAGGAVADGAGAGVVVAVGTARTSRVATTPMFPPPQRP